jgi:hypothetical protein
MKFNRPIDPRTPEVLLELDWPQKTPFNSFLEIEIQFCNKSSREIVRTHLSRAPWEKEVGLYKYSENQKQLVNMSNNAFNEESDLSVIKRLRRWEKFVEFPSMLPDRLIWKYESEA